MTESATGSQASAAESVVSSSAATSTVETAVASSVAATTAESVVTSSTVATSAGSSAATVPETYDLKLPKDSKLPPAIVERTAANARALGLSNEAGQKLLDAVVSELTERDKAVVADWEPGKGAAWKERDAAWRAEALADAEIGGTPEKLATSATLAKQVVEKFFDPKIAEFLQASGFGSHPEFLRGLAKIGRGMSEGTLTLGSAGTSGKKDPATILYGEDGRGPKPSKKE